MGQQQLVLIILGVIIVGIAISVGIALFSGESVSANKDAIMNDLMGIGQYALRYFLRPEPLGGGGRTYTGFTLPAQLSQNDNADYSVVTSPKSVSVTATSKFGYGTATAILDSTGLLSSFTYTGDLQ